MTSPILFECIFGGVLVLYSNDFCIFKRYPNACYCARIRHDIAAVICLDTIEKKQE